jgi:hypothetical protein
MYEFNYTVGKNISNFSPLPAGTYIGAIIASQIKISQTGNRYLNLTFEIQENEDQTRRLFECFNLWHTNPIVVEIAEKKCNQLCHALGYAEETKIINLDVLHYKSIRIHIGIDKKDQDRNIIYGFGKIKENPKNINTESQDEVKEFNDEIPF